MFNATEKVCSEIKQILEKSEKWEDAKKQGYDIYIRLGIIPEGDDFAYTFQLDTDREKDDVCFELHGLKFVFSQSFASKMNTTTLDFSDEENHRGILFKNEEDEKLV